MIHKIGIELEGGWDTFPPPWDDKVVPIIQDLSIDGNTMPNDGRLRNPHVGEVVSPPLLLTEWEKWVTNAYPTTVNNTCGLHVHVSFTKKKEYAALMAKGYERNVLLAARGLAKKIPLPPEHYIWPRLKGENIFAKFDVSPHEQLAVKEKRIGMRARYAAFNYCWSMHGTLEYRVLPMFKEGAATAIKFIKSFLKVTEEEIERRSINLPSFGCSLREHNNIIEEREAR